MLLKRKNEVQSLDTMRKVLWMDNVPQELLYREDELDQIAKFCQLFIEQKDDCRSLYLGGVPGTGKTSCVLRVCHYLSASNNIFSDNSNSARGSKLQQKV